MSMINKEKERIIPPKNYLYLTLIIILTILLLLYILKWNKTYNDSKLYTGILNEYLQVINYNELNDYIIENKDAVIYVSILGNEKIRDFEKKFKNTITNNNLRNKILYLDITNEDQRKVKEKLKIENDLPYLVVFTNGKITDTYSIPKVKYDPKKIMKYLNRIGAIDID
ncbi:MAG: hypothetical protein IJI49_04330 [Bacilli bacterium]|nr:hypothetical protein [Bacilli bacterium]